MIDSHLTVRLQELLRRESRSLLQYVPQAHPWIGPKDHELWDKIQAMAARERQWQEHCAEFLQNAHLPIPSLGAFPAAFTGYHFMTLRSLLPKIHDLGQQDLDFARSVLDQVQEPNVHALVQELVDLKTRHLSELGKSL